MLVINYKKLVKMEIEDRLAYIIAMVSEFSYIIYKFSTCLKIRRVFVRDAILPQHFHNNFNLCETGGKKDYRRAS